MKKIIFILSILMIINFRGFAVEKIFDSIPKEISGWKTEAADEVYDRETLYEYINGGAELYLTYDFQNVFARRFMKENAPEIVLEIYDMNSSKDAYGIFSSERQDKEAGIGQDSEYGGGLLRFWKDKYFVSILAIGDEAIARPVILELGKKVAEAIPATGQQPEILKYLPQENLIKNKLRFFHTHTILNRQYYLASENILNLNRQTDCVFAPYQIGANKTYTLIVKYESQTKAKFAYESFLKGYLPEALRTGFVQMENKKWSALKLDNELLIIIFESPNQQLAESLLSGVEHLIKLNR
ncbi:hypothetical protein L0Z72_14685 [candidate division KSB1 bacterium]|nr:hypothetical protein [candidate division KSB1 bacterium]